MACTWSCGSRREGAVCRRVLQALEKVLKASIVLADEEPPLTHELSTLADLAGVSLTPLLLGLQPGDRQQILAALEGLTQGLESRLNP